MQTLTLFTILCLVVFAVCLPANCGGGGARGNTLDVETLDADVMDEASAHDCSRKNVCTFPCSCGKTQYFELQAKSDVDAYINSCLTPRRLALVAYCQSQVAMLTAAAVQFVPTNECQPDLDQIKQLHDGITVKVFSDSVHELCTQSQTGVTLTAQNVLQTIFNISDATYNAKFAPITNNNDPVIQIPIDAVIKGFMAGAIPIYMSPCLCTSFLAGNAYDAVRDKGCASLCPVAPVPVQAPVVLPNVAPVKPVVPIVPVPPITPKPVVPVDVPVPVKTPEVAIKVPVPVKNPNVVPVKKPVAIKVPTKVPTPVKKPKVVPVKTRTGPPVMVDTKKKTTKKSTKKSTKKVATAKKLTFKADKKKKHWKSVISKNKGWKDVDEASNMFNEDPNPVKIDHEIIYGKQ
jgi:hypothetical protein